MHVTLRVPDAIAERLGQVAAYHGRSRHAECIIALSIYDAISTLDTLESPEAKATMTEADRAAAKDRVQRDLHEYLATGLRRPDPPLHHLLDDESLTIH